MKKIRESIENLNKYLETFENLFKENEGLKDISEYVYKYTETENWYFNETLFRDFMDLDIEDLKKISKDKLYEMIVDKYDSIISQLSDIRLKAPNKISTADDLKTLLIVNYRDYLINMFQLVKYWALFEIEKTGIYDKFLEVKRDYNLKQVKKYDKIIFWEEIQNDKYLLSLINWKLLSLKEKIDNLSEKEREVVNKILEFLEKKQVQAQSPEEVIWKNKLPAKELSVEDAKEIFENIFKIYGIDKKVKIDDSLTSVYDAESYLGLPVKKYWVAYLLHLITHEIETHYITQENHKILAKTLDIKDSNYLEREESLAKLFEEYAIEDKKLKISVLPPIILAGEIFDIEDLKVFIDAYFKLVGKKPPKNRFLRAKRNYPFDKQWVQHKDLSYTSGMRKIYNWLEDDDVTKLFWWKFDFDTIKQIDESGIVDDRKLLYPLLIWEILRYKLENWKITHEDFLQYIGKRYSFLKNMDKLTTKKLTWEQKRKLVEILKKTR